MSYQDGSTATIDSITPRYGTVAGGETIVIAGTNFVAGSTTVTIDGVDCGSLTATTTEITCTTGERIGDQPNPTFVVHVDG